MATDDETPPSAPQASENLEGQSMTTSATVPAPTSADSSSNKSENSDNNRDIKAEDDVDNDSEDSATEINIRMPMAAPGAPRQPRSQPSMLLRGIVVSRTSPIKSDETMDRLSDGGKRMPPGKRARRKNCNRSYSRSLHRTPNPPTSNPYRRCHGQPVRTAAVEVDIPRPTPTAASEPVLDRIGEFVLRSIDS
ncbi:hypothetical protein GCK72_015336 [Caenorhabditis remanei]|uniref:Uncharacterized protein n=1 Tax=Caenorhabditis remanei TaxID=31234 RepID=A0A6A5GW86_CAERE|nr:hypothetical protein GCK72_015336 [Caenorhabditis remanei]KAF1758876.1 hypothetical protein GCK72_015336 [Caenorhabditis remanei]